MHDFAKYFSFPGAVPIFYSVIVFAAAFLIYQFLLFLFRQLEDKKSTSGKLKEELRYPTLLILFEIAAIISTHLLIMPEKLEHITHHTINVMIIGTLGWFAVGIARAFYKAFISKNGTSAYVDIQKRSTLTQVLFLYRLLIFIIFAVTVAAILLTFPYIKSVGLGILGSAGIAGIALGIAARPILLNLMVGFQIAITKMIKIGDAIHIEGELASIESIHLTRVVVCTWDLRRIVIPISYFIDKPFQNWDLTNPELLGSVFLYCDYGVPIEAIRQKVAELLESHPNWNKRVWSVQITNCTDHCLEIRVVASANDAPAMFDLRYYLRENLISFLQKEYPSSLPCMRSRQVV